MSIYRRASGRWAVLVDMDRKADGERQRRTLGTFATRKEAQIAERNALASRLSGVEVAPGKITLEQLFERFIRDAECRAEEPLSGTTIHVYRQIWKRVDEPTAKMSVAKLLPAHITELTERLSVEGWAGGSGPLSARSVRHTRALLSRVLNWGIEESLVTRNVTEKKTKVRRKKSRPKPVRPYERRDAERLIEEAAKTRYAALVIFGFETGLRRGELAALRWSDVDVKRRSAVICGSIGQIPGKSWYKPTKTDLVARIALSDFAIEALRSQRARQAKDKLAAGAFYDDQEFVFASELGGMPSPGAISHAIRRLAARAGLSIRGVHAMRHSTGSWLIQSGVDIRTVAALLRHSSASTTLNVYAHEMEGAQAEAVGHLLGSSLASNDRSAKKAGD